MTGISKAPETALGVRAHSGWAAFVVLGGDPKKPDIVARGRMTLCESADARMLFHAAEPMPLERAERFIAERRAATAELADKALGALGPVCGCCVLAASGRALPELKGILASHSLIHAAEGEFYRDAVAQACLRAGIAVHHIRERDIADEAEHLEDSKRRLAAFGKRLGAPWTRDEKLATLGAWLVLAALRKP